MSKDTLLERGRKMRGGTTKKIPNANSGATIQKAPAHKVLPKARYIYDKWIMGQPLEKVLKLDKLCGKGAKKRPTGCMGAYAPNKKKNMF